MTSKTSPIIEILAATSTIALIAISLYAVMLLIRFLEGGLAP